MNFYIRAVLASEKTCYFGTDGQWTTDFNTAHLFKTQDDAERFGAAKIVSCEFEVCKRRKVAA